MSLLFIFREQGNNPVNIKKGGHYRPTNEMPLTWCFAGVPMVALQVYLVLIGMTNLNFEGTGKIDTIAMGIRDNKIICLILVEHLKGNILALHFY